jgi:hypothetical protein
MLFSQAQKNRDISSTGKSLSLRHNAYRQHGFESANISKGIDDLEQVLQFAVSVLCWSAILPKRETLT